MFDKSLIEYALKGIRQAVIREIKFPVSESETISLNFNITDYSLKSISFDGFVNKKYFVNDDEIDNMESFFLRVNEDLAKIFDASRYEKYAGKKFTLKKNGHKIQLIGFDKEAGKMHFDYVDLNGVGWCHVNDIDWSSGDVFQCNNCKDTKKSMEIIDHEENGDSVLGKVDCPLCS